MALVVAVGVAVGGAYAARRAAPDRPAAPGARAATARPAPPTDRPVVPTNGRAAGAITYPAGGTGTFRTATALGAVAGRGGRLLRYRVAVEQGIGNVDVERFAREVAVILADPRGWTGGGEWRLQRVGRDDRADFSVLLTTPVTRGRLCADPADHYTSCRNGDQVVINVARWVHGVPHFPDLADYRRYLLNHEVGHRLGRGHELCPRAGGPAPVMLQQTLNLHGCTPNAWPEVDGALLSGPSGQYDDPIPAEDPPAGDG
ncbi:DUF3152 domain-containing protein [Micromonospora sp. PPF5-17]|uniref:DUF3152 domain-containing protein n=1 Tax=Micromonospora solifontis TaxID=2487138 RepID=A0ABX9WKL4_9ACTN|nr:DUF3152 domain-containing protein [Micromonospora sp. PPF5-17B]NES35346.1 DUF3152 domain-containing protein [Micromonospora solifontis]NES56172.1 DUF3152 domain-containing protein [Micromonospora sp. PPF5-6]RNM00915.1 DUF3152 domain-containing protein [Micromonospora solifontis]